MKHHMTMEWWTDLWLNEDFRFCDKDEGGGTKTALCSIFICWLAIPEVLDEISYKKGSAVMNAAGLSWG
ncbi:hypothetical protein COP2_025418 [Malus domestica]